MLVKITDDAKLKLAQMLSSEGTKEQFLQDLIVQGCLMLLEDQVEIRCLPEDSGSVRNVLGKAEATYKKIIQEQAGPSKDCKITLSNSPLPAESLGGVILECGGGSITIDNTIS